MFIGNCKHFLYALYIVFVALSPYVLTLIIACHHCKISAALLAVLV